MRHVTFLTNQGRKSGTLIQQNYNTVVVKLPNGKVIKRDIHKDKVEEYNYIPIEPCYQIVVDKFFASVMSEDREEMESHLKVLYVQFDERLGLNQLDDDPVFVDFITRARALSDDLVKLVVSVADEMDGNNNSKKGEE